MLRIEEWNQGVLLLATLDNNCKRNPNSKAQHFLKEDDVPELEEVRDFVSMLDREQRLRLAGFIQGAKFMMFRDKTRR